jgi:hypothetical protein
MSNKINLVIEGKERPNLSILFKSFINKHFTELRKRVEHYYEVFPFLLQFGLNDEDVESLLRYYGYIDDNNEIVSSNIVNDEDDDDSTSNGYYWSRGNWDEDDYWDEYEELHYDSSKKRNKDGKFKHVKQNKPRGSEDSMLDITKPYSQGFIDECDKNDDDKVVAQYIFFYPNYGDKTDKLEFNSLHDFDEFCSNNEYFVPAYVAEDIAYRPVSHVCINPGPLYRGGVDEIMSAESYGDMFYEACEEYESVFK